MEDVVTRRETWRDRVVLVTGHTGFKGGWLSHWLRHLGASVHGLSLEPPTTPSFFEAARVASAVESDTRTDVADLEAVRQCFAQAKPGVVFHLAAQPLVLEGYRDPIRTFSSNVIGTAHVLEAARATQSVEALVLITTDKVYENRESMHAYVESDPLGGRDPYSASKAAAEIAIGSFRASFFGSGERMHPGRVASARAGNVIGGGDWANDRLVPDCLRAFESSAAVELRNPQAVRPWQHVLEPLSGYLSLAERMLTDLRSELPGAWNFGPDERGDATVAEVANLVAQSWGPGARVIQAPVDGGGQPHEAGLLRLDSARAREMLHWSPRWSLRQAIEHTVAWHKAWRRKEDMRQVTLGQIEAYEPLVEH